MKGKGNSLLLRLRDKFFSNVFLRIQSGDGLLPFQKGDLVAQSLWIDGCYEDGDRALLRKLLPVFDCFIDVGANIGIYTLLASRHIRAGGEVFAFEPSPLEFAKLEKTIVWNSLSNVIAECVAVGSESGTVGFYESTTGAGALNRIGKPAKRDLPFQLVTVPCIALDDYFATKPSIATFIKVDVEGFELPVLKGAQNFLQRTRPTIMMEMVESRASEWSSPGQVWDFLVARGYGWYGLAEADNLLHPVTRNSGENRNLLAIHADNFSQIASCFQ